jgi:tRNA A37 threonylcarbamoyladenosine modification protein TsaB
MIQPPRAGVDTQESGRQTVCEDGFELGDSVQVGDSESGLPDGRRLIELARALWDGGQRDDFWFLEPNYLRRSAAEEQWARLGR